MARVFYLGSSMFHDHRADIQFKPQGVKANRIGRDTRDAEGNVAVLQVATAVVDDETARAFYVGHPAFVVELEADEQVQSAKKAAAPKVAPVADEKPAPKKGAKE